MSGPSTPLSGGAADQPGHAAGAAAERHEHAVTIDSFRGVMSRWTSGITVITTAHGEIRHGMVASSFSSVSTDPVTVLFCADHGTRTYPLVRDSGIFAVNILSTVQEDTFWTFAGRKGDPAADRFAGLDVFTAITGAPILRHNIAWLDCKVIAEHPGGKTHSIFIGEVVAADFGADESIAPLVYFNRKVRHLADAKD
jgi:flavin reductase (DIM6/NTAB) family NADH-FMN oxidoreductase RutF